MSLQIPLFEEKKKDLPKFLVKKKKIRKLSKNEILKSVNLCVNSPLSESLLYRLEVYKIFKSVAIISFLVKV